MSILDRDLVTVGGPDAFSFLQSLVSQDVEGLDDGAVVPSLLLTPKGKVQAYFRIVRVGDEAWLDIEAGFGEPLRAALERFKLRVKVEIAAPVEPWGMVAIRDDAFGEVDHPPPSTVVLPVGWSTTTGVDVIGPRTELGELAARGLDADQFERARVEAGIPRLGRDLDESTIPQEAWLDRDAVSFTKGCYLGQELVARIDSRGHVNRLLRWIRPSDPESVLEPGAEVDLGGKVAVTVVGYVTSAVAGLALGYVRREVEVPTEAFVFGAPVTIEPLPGRE